MVRFFYKNNETSSLGFKNWCCSQNLTIVQKHLKIWGIRNKINLRKPYFFKFIILKKKFKMYQFYNFCQFFYDIWLYFAFDAKIKVYKRNLWSRWFFGMKVHCIRSVYSKYLFEISSKSIFDFFFRQPTTFAC